MGPFAFVDKLSSGGKRMRTRAFLGIISPRKAVWVDVLAYLNLVPEAEGGTNARPSDTVEKGTNARLGTPLEGRYACGTAPDGFARANECAAEPAAAAEGDARAGASTAAACEANTSPGTPLEGGYASRAAPDSFMKVKECECTAEGDAHVGASIVGACTAGAGMAVQASVFAAAETALGLARLPDLSPPAYRSIYLQERLPLAGPMRSVSVFLLTRLFRFGVFLIPMRLAVSAQVF